MPTGSLAMEKGSTFGQTEYEQGAAGRLPLLPRVA